MQSTQLNTTSGNSICTHTVQGPRGRDGRDGLPGRDGRDGVPGRQGPPGPQGILVDLIPRSAIQHLLAQ